MQNNSLYLHLRYVKCTAILMVDCSHFSSSAAEHTLKHVF